METEAETQYQDWGDYGGQHWGVDRVKLQFKTGQSALTSQVSSELPPNAPF